MMNLVQQYQTRIVGIHENVDYVSIISQSFPPAVLQREPLFGFKVLMKDMNQTKMGMNPGNRILQIERYLSNPNTAFLLGTGCFIRETEPSFMQDGFWLITFPVPMKYLDRQYENLMSAANMLGRVFGIVRNGPWEINVSGVCNNVEQSMTNLYIPDDIMNKYFVNRKSAYYYGNVVRLNSSFILLRTTWAFPPKNEMAYFDKNYRPDMYRLKDVVMTICHMMPPIFR